MSLHSWETFYMNQNNGDWVGVYCKNGKNTLHLDATDYLITINVSHNFEQTNEQMLPLAREFAYI